MPPVEFDLDEIRERLTVAAVLRAAGDDEVDDLTKRMPCPICGASEESFSIFAEGRRYECHRGSCGKKGDALSLLRWLWPESFPRVVERAARLVGIASGRVDPVLRVRRDAERAKRRAQQAEAQRVRAAESTRVSTEYWISLMRDEWERDRWARLHDYLHVRGLADVLSPCGGFDSQKRIYAPFDPRLRNVLLPSERGELALVIVDDVEVAWNASFAASVEHVIVGVAIRGVNWAIEHEHDLATADPIIVWWDRSPKVRCHPGSCTRGTFGKPRSVIRGGRCVLVEGMADFVAAHLAYPDPVDGVLGAHSAGMIEHAAGVACRRLGPGGELVLVTHADDAGRAAGAGANAVAAAHGVRVSHHDLGGHKDLADQVAAR